VGLDRIDIAACRRRGVEVVHTPDANSQAVAEYVFAVPA
jgi:D-3-phosphoglycerate dehydrogenase